MTGVQTCALPIYAFNYARNAEGLTHVLAMSGPARRLRVKAMIHVDGADGPGRIFAQLAQCMQQDMGIDATAVRNFYDGTRIEMCAEYLRQRAFGESRFSFLQISRIASDALCAWRRGSPRRSP